MESSATVAARPQRNLMPAIVGLATFAAIAAAGLWWSKWSPYAGKLNELLGKPVWSGNFMLNEAGGAGSAPSISGSLDFAGAYFEDIWPGFLAALGIAAAADALIPREWLMRTLSRRNGGRGSLVGGLAALPSLMCTCCTAPIAVTLRRDGVPTSTSLAYWLGNPVLNPAVIAFLALVAPWQWVLTRVLIGSLLVFGGTALVARLTGRTAQESAHPAELSRFALRDTPHSFLRTFLRLFVRLVPIYVLLVLLLGAFRGWIFPLDAGAAQAVIPAFIAAALLGTLVVIPTAGEIPILLALAAAGVNPAVLGVLLITLPAISIVSMFMVGRTFTVRVTIAMAGTVALCGALAGGLLLALTG